MGMQLLRGVRLRRQLRRAWRLARELRMIAWALLDVDHVVLAHLVPIRRCNLACGYCNEYDHSSSPVPIATLQARVDHLARLGTSVITISGGEPLLHPELGELVAHIRRRGMIAGLITNGFLLSRQRILQLNEAGLDHLQISIDNVVPDEVSKKSLKTLEHRLQLLAQYAEFHVNINTVLGSGVRNPEDALVIARRAEQLGFSWTVGIIHDHGGRFKPLDERHRRVYYALQQLRRNSYSRFHAFQDDIVEGRTRQWRCRAGARYLYVCESGLVHYCSQQRGYPGVRLEDYTLEDLRREYRTAKSCAPGCTISCVNQVSLLDAWRAPQEPRASLIGGPLIQIDRQNLA